MTLRELRKRWPGWRFSLNRQTLWCVQAIRCEVGEPMTIESRNPRKATAYRLLNATIVAFLKEIDDVQ